MKLYWTCHVRGFNHAELREKGFVVPYPTVEDYAFLEAKEENRQLVEDQGELGLIFITISGKLGLSTQEEVDMMMGTTRGGIEPGTLVRVTKGRYVSLEGVVKSVEGDELVVELEGFAKKYEARVKVVEVVKKEQIPVDRDDLGEDSGATVSD